MEWLVGGSLHGMILIQLAHESGEYERCLYEVRQLGFVKEFSAAA
jgi:hypothetical protein